MDRPKRSAPGAPESDFPSREAEAGATETRSRAGGPLEALFQEAVRRATALGLSGFFMTEEAVRRALSDTVPQEWVDYISRQSDDVRSDTIDRIVSEFGSWLRSVDLADVIRTVLEDYEIEAKIEISAERKQSDPALSLKLARHRK